MEIDNSCIHTLRSITNNNEYHIHPILSNPAITMLQSLNYRHLVNNISSNRQHNNSSFQQHGVPTHGSRKHDLWCFRWFLCIHCHQLEITCSNTNTTVMYILNDDIFCYVVLNWRYLWICLFCRFHSRRILLWVSYISGN